MEETAGTDTTATTENNKKEVKQVYSTLLDDATTSAITSVQNDVMK